MNMWEAKYKALSMGIGDQEYIDNAEHLVKAAQTLTAHGLQSFEQIVGAMMHLVAMQQPIDTDLPEWAKTDTRWRLASGTGGVME